MALPLARRKWGGELGVSRPVAIAGTCVGLAAGVVAAWWMIHGFGGTYEVPSSDEVYGDFITNRTHSWGRQRMRRTPGG